jgi:hypothetical protein
VRGIYTSAANIGVYLWAVVAARDLGLIDRTQADSLARATLDEVSALKRYDGFLFQWYDTNTGNVLLNPRYGCVMELADYHQWWKHQGGQELRRLLMDQWDPIGVNGAPEAADEYDGYRGGVLQLLRDGASAAAVATHLARVERERMGFETTPERLQPVAEQLVRWHPDSLARWEKSHPTTST